MPVVPGGQALRAVAALAADGKLSVEQGRGTFVQTAPLINYHIGRRTRFRQNLLDQGIAPAGEQIAEDIIPAPAQIAAALGIAEGDAVHRLLRRGLADGVPISIGLSYGTRGVGGAKWRAHRVGIGDRLQGSSNNDPPVEEGTA